MSSEPLFPTERVDSLSTFDAEHLNAAAALVVKVNGRYVPLSKRYDIAAEILRVIEVGMARA